MTTARMFVALVREIPGYVAGRLDAWVDRMERRGAP